MRAMDQIIGAGTSHEMGVFGLIRDVLVTTNKKNVPKEAFKPTLIIEFSEEAQAKIFFELSEKAKRQGLFEPGHPKYGIIQAICFTVLLSYPYVTNDRLRRFIADEYFH